MVDWDNDGKKDVLVGLSDGCVKFFRNTNTDAAPALDGGTLVLVSTDPLDVAFRAAPTLVNWDNDGGTDLVVGSLDEDPGEQGRVWIFINTAVPGEQPVFSSYEYATYYCVDPLEVPGGRASPVIRDLDNDGKKDLLAGNGNGNLLFYHNIGADTWPYFDEFPWPVTGGATEIQVAGRSRPFVCDWTNDGRLDVLIGASDGYLHLYQGYRRGDLNCNGEVDFDDIDPFIVALSSPMLYALAYPDCDWLLNGDCNEDGTVDFADINDFVGLLSAP